MKIAFLVCAAKIYLPGMQKCKKTQIKKQYFPRSWRFKAFSMVGRMHALQNGCTVVDGYGRVFGGDAESQQKPEVVALRWQI